MKYLDIAKIQTVIRSDKLKEYAGSGTSGVHESVFRSWHIMKEVRELLLKKVDSEVILQLIDIMELDHQKGTEDE